MARQKQVEWLAGGSDRRPYILAPFDAELFGHWWFEGPQWMELFIRNSAYDQRAITFWPRRPTTWPSTR